MRKSFDGLSGLVRNHMNGDPHTGDVFVFVNRVRTHIKLLYWDGDGFVLFYKRLECGTFAIAASDVRTQELRRDELVLMLEGIDRIDTRRRLRYSQK